MENIWPFVSKYGRYQLEHWCEILAQPWARWPVQTTTRVWCCPADRARFPRTSLAPRLGCAQPRHFWKEAVNFEPSTRFFFEKYHTDKPNIPLSFAAILRQSVCDIAENNLHKSRTLVFFLLRSWAEYSVNKAGSRLVCSSARPFRNGYACTYSNSWGRVERSIRGNNTKREVLDHVSTSAHHCKQITVGLFEAVWLMCNYVCSYSIYGDWKHRGDRKHTPKNTPRHGRYVGLIPFW